MAFSPGDKVFAKVKGHPHWPCRINLLPPDVHVPKGKYPIFFYGTHEVYFLGPKDLFAYDKFKSKYAINRNKPAFQDGLREIEENPEVLLYGKDPDAELFLARFYKFNPTSGQGLSSVQTQKRPGTSPARTNSQSAKRPHVEVEATGKSSKTPTKRPRSSVPQDGTPTPVTPKPKSPSSRMRTPVQPKKVPASTEAVDAVTPILSADKLVETKQSLPEEQPALPQRVSSLRLRIRKGADGLKFSPAPESLSSLSPSTPSSASTLEQNQHLDDVKSPPNDPLRITIKQIASTVVSEDGTVSDHLPVFSITPSNTSTLIGVSIDSTATSRKKSTAVVTPLRRDKAPPEVSDDLSGLSSLDECDTKVEHSPLVSPSRKENQRIRPGRLSASSSSKKQHYKRKSKPKESVTHFSNINVGSENGSSSTATSWTPNDYSKNGVDGIAKSATDVPIPSPKVHPDKRPTTSSPSPVVSSPTRSVNDVVVPDSRHLQEQQLKDLDTEARLLLIDRSIKSSLVRDHEDISTCVDRLEMLDRIPFTLPVLAKCWPVVETIGKCRRYKRSMEVKIAAQKVFNKFLHLYASADKYEFDLAVAELARHQQRHMKIHAARSSEPAIPDSPIPAYTGPKSLAELFQVSAGVLAERRRLSCVPTGEGRIDRSPCANLTSAADSVKLSNHSELTLSIGSKDRLEFGNNDTYPSYLTTKMDLCDIPLPDEDTPRLSKCKSSDRHVPPSTTAMTGNPEEEYEVLDEYEATSDQKAAGFQMTDNITQPSLPQMQTAPHPGIVEYTPVSVVETQIIPYSMVPPHLIPTSYCLENPMLSCSTTVASYTAPYSIVPNAVPYSFGCYTTSSYPQVIHPASHLALSVPYTAAVGGSVYPMGIEVTLPQTASRAFVPHSLLSSTNLSPSPHHPHVSNNENKAVLDSPKRSDSSIVRISQSDITSQSSFTRPTPIIKANPAPLSPARSNLSGRSEEGDRPRSQNVRHFRSPPHRARSPHALPHPLEHYQRCLTSALGSEGESRTHHHRSSHKYDRVDGYHSSGRSSERCSSDRRRYATDNANRYELTPVSISNEDLDARIARIMGTTNEVPSRRPVTTKPSSSGTHQDSRKAVPPMASPPPPPPPPPASQRVLFTHRPQQTRSPKPQSSFGQTNSSVSPIKKPPPTPDSPPPRRHRSSTCDNITLSKDQRSTLKFDIVRLPNTTSDSPHVKSLSINGPREDDGPLRAPADSSKDIADSDRFGDRDEDRDLYSLLGV